MFLTLLFLAVIQIIFYESIGSVVKRIFKIELKQMNLIIGYSFSLLIFYLVNVYFIVNHYPYKLFTNTLFPIYIIIMVVLVILSIKRKSTFFDFFVLLFILIYIYHFFTLSFIVPGESTYYFTTINQNINKNIYLSIFQTYTLLHASFFNINSTIYTVNVVTFIHLFIILYTIYEVFSILFIEKKTSRYAFLFFMLLFTVVNTTSRFIFLPINAYDFIHHPYSGRSIYLFAVIPFQISLFYRYNKKNYLLLLLINMSCMAFTSISLFMQFLINIAYILTLIFIKAYNTPRLLSTLILVSLIPLSLHLVIYTYQPNIRILYGIVVSVIFLFIFFLTYEHKYHHRRMLYISSIFFVLFILVIYSYLFTHFNPNIKDDFLYQLKMEYNEERMKILLFYGLGIYALFKIKNTNLSTKKVLFYLPIIILIIIINPITIYFVLNQNIHYIYLFYLIPITLSIVYVFIKRTRAIEKAIILLMILSVTQTIYKPLVPLKDTDINFYYRLDNEIITISKYLNQYKDIKNILVSSELVNEITVITNQANLLLNYESLQKIDEENLNEDLLLMYYTINDKIPIDVVFFIENVNEFEIDAIVVDKNKSINTYLTLLSQSKEEFNYYIVYTF